jgi:hypothetical protein
MLRLPYTAQQIKQTFVDKDDKRMFFLKKFVIVEQENKIMLE